VKKIIFVLSLVLVLVLPSMVMAGPETIIRIDSETVEFNEDLGFPFIDENYRTQVPFRATMEKYGAEVDWDGENNTAVAVKDGIVVKVPLGEKFILKNDEKIEIDSPALMKDGRIYLPIRHVIEAFGSKVEWDEAFNTVVIAEEDLDIRELLLTAYDKSNQWENFDSLMTMFMEIPIKDEEGQDQRLEIEMLMEMTAFQEPFKAKASMDMIIDFGGLKFPQNIMNMYYNIEDGKMTTYMEMPIADGQMQWVKQSQESELFENLIKDKEASMKANSESIVDVKYFGKYLDEKDRSLLRVENTTSFEAYEDLLGGYVDILTSSGKEEDQMAAEILTNMDDMIFIVYIDEDSGEIVKYEMDLGPLMKSMFDNMGDLIPKEEMGILSDLKVLMEMEILNVNEAEDFEIPEEALNAVEVEELDIPQML